MGRRRLPDDKQQESTSSISLSGSQDRSLKVTCILNPLMPLEMLGEKCGKMGMCLRAGVVLDDEALMTRLPLGESALTSLISMRKTSPFFITSEPLHQMF